MLASTVAAPSARRVCASVTAMRPASARALSLEVRFLMAWASTAIASAAAPRRRGAPPPPSATPTARPTVAARPSSRARRRERDRMVVASGAAAVPSAAATRKPPPSRASVASQPQPTHAQPLAWPGGRMRHDRRTARVRHLDPPDRRAAPRARSASMRDRGSTGAGAAASPCGSIVDSEVRPASVAHQGQRQRLDAQGQKARRATDERAARPTPPSSPSARGQLGRLRAQRRRRRHHQRLDAQPREEPHGASRSKSTSSFRFARAPSPAGAS